MKKLTLLRHAKSGWDDAVARDFDRPLNQKGRRAAQRVGEHIRRQGLAFDHVIASPATRVVETLAAVASGAGRDFAPTFEPRAYLASASTLLDLIRETPDAASDLLLVGHNPGLEELALLLVPEATRERAIRDIIALKYPTGALAEIAVAVESWEELEAGGGTLLSFTRPRDLDPALGPDEDEF
jgi:phosphohistidine phosphatase